MIKGTVRFRIYYYKEFVSSRFLCRENVFRDLIPCNLKVDDPLDKSLPFNDIRGIFKSVYIVIIF